jgi:drug/metabolite transporter (DMT)-like permease
MRYALGITAAIIAGLAFNVGLLIQKAAVGRAPKDKPLMRSLLKSPVWISGFVLQFILGTPLYTLSVGLIGPAIVPGLMSVGLVVLALGAVLVQKERLALKEIAGIALVVAAVALFGFTRLSIDVHAVSMKDPGLLVRAGLFSGALLAIALVCAEVARRLTSRAESSAAFHATRAGVWYNLGNLGLGFITAGLARFGAGTFDPGEMAVFLAAVGLTVAGNMYGIAATQHALARGRAAVAIPLQNAVTQVLPVFVFFLVYRPYVPSVASLAFLGAAGALLLGGVVLLTGRLAAKS